MKKVIVYTVETLYSYSPFKSFTNKRKAIKYYNDISKNFQPSIIKTTIERIK